MSLRISIAIAAALLLCACAATRRPTTGSAPLGAAEAFLKADQLDATGEPAQALAFYFEALEAAKRNGGPAPEAIAAAMGTVQIRSRVDRFEARFRALSDRLARIPGRLPDEAAFQLANLKLGLERRAGDDAAARETARHAGCIARWRMAGPFGPWVWERFDDAVPPAPTGPWPATVDLGPARGASPVRDLSSDTCFLTVENRSLPLSGIHWSRSTIVLDRPGTVRFRLQTGAAAIVRVGGVEVARRDPRRRFLPDVSWFELPLPAGPVDVAVGLFTEQPSASFSLVAVDARGNAAFSAADPGLVPRHGPLGSAVAVGLDPQSPGPGFSDTYARARIALFWDDGDRACDLLEPLAASPDGGSAPVLLALAEAAMQDPALPGDVALERGRAIERSALEKEPRLWRARVDLAEHELSEERVDEALSLLSEGIEVSPAEPELLERLASLFLYRGWLKEGRDLVLGRLKPLLPDACEVRTWELEIARDLLDFPRAAEIARTIAGCDSRSPVLAEELARAQDWRGALAERRRLAAQDPRSWVRADDATRTGAADAPIDEILPLAEQSLSLSPADPTLRKVLADLSAASGDGARARDLLESALAIPGADRREIEAAAAAIDRRSPWAEMRVDGLEAIARYRAESPRYDASAVYVLDRAVYRVYADGGYLALIRTIVRLQSDEAVETHGEFSLPEDALLLTARTIKADGAILTPEAIAGKPTLSMPDLAIGDFVETEYAILGSPSRFFPGGFDTDRFYFQDFKTAFHRSEIAVVAPRRLDLQIDPRGACPPARDRVEGDLRVLTWQVRGSVPFPEEPRAPSGTEFLPSIRVTAGAGFDPIDAFTRDLLGDKMRRSRPIRTALAEISAALPGGDAKALRRAAYRYVTGHIEPGDDLFEQASHILVQGAGSRARAFLAILDAAGQSPRLALAKPSGADDTPGAVPYFGLYGVPVVWVEGDGFLAFDIDDAPYGYLAPELRNRPVRFVDNGETGTTGTGAVAWDEQKIDLRIRVAGESARAEVREELTGILANDWRERFGRVPESDRGRLFEERYLASAMAGASLVRLAVGPIEDPEKPLVLEYEVEIPRFGRRDGNALRAEIPFHVDLAERTGGLPARRTALLLPSQTRKRLSVSIELAEGQRADIAAAEADAVQSRWGSGTRWRSGSGNRLEFGYEAELRSDRIVPADYPEFLEFAGRLDRLSTFSLRLW